MRPCPAAIRDGGHWTSGLVGEAAGRQVQHDYRVAGHAREHIGEFPRLGRGRIDHPEAVGLADAEAERERRPVQPDAVHRERAVTPDLNQLPDIGALKDQSEQHVPGADVVMTETSGFLRQEHSAPRLVAELLKHTLLPMWLLGLQISSEYG